MPGDTSVFTYDPLGNIRSATNHDASVSRTYFPNGALKTETQRIRAYTGEDTTAHAYTLTYAYDLEGRRTSLTVPGAVTAGSGVQRYGYDPATRPMLRDGPPGDEQPTNMATFSDRAGCQRCISAIIPLVSGPATRRATRGTEHQSTIRVLCERRGGSRRRTPSASPAG